MANYTRAEKQISYVNMNGGLATRPSFFILDGEKKLSFSSLRNTENYINGAIRKKFSDTQQGNQVVAAATQGIFDYRFGNAQTQKVIVSANGAIYYKDGSNYTSIHSGWTAGAANPTSFTTIKGLLIAANFGNSIPRVWDGVSTGMMAAGYRMSPLYTGIAGLAITSIAGSTLTMTANQAASGIYNGKVIMLTGGATTSPEYVTVKSFATSGTAGTATYYVTSIVVVEKPQTDRTTVKHNGIALSFAAAGGSITISGAATCLRLMSVTELKSGGYRTVEYSIDLTAGASRLLTLASIVMNASTDGTQFAFDIGDKATTWFMTQAFDPTLDPTNSASAFSKTFYKIPTSMISTALNPMANSVTTFDISNIVAGTENTLLDEYGLEDEYFLSQIDIPYFKYLEVFNGFLTGGGDPQNLIRVYFSEYLGPNVWSTFGGTLGNFIEIDNDSEPLSGLASWADGLYTHKQHSIHRVEFTGNSEFPFNKRILPSDFGAMGHFGIIRTAKFMAFISEQGPMACYGTTVDFLPNAWKIQTYWDQNDSNAWSPSLLKLCSGAHDRNKNRVVWTIGTNGKTTADALLYYDYENQAFDLTTSQDYACIAEVSDTNLIRWIWGGTSAGRIYRLGDATPGAQASSFTCQRLFMDDPLSWKNFTGIMMAFDYNYAAAATGMTITLQVDTNSVVTHTLNSASTPIWANSSAGGYIYGFYFPIGQRGKTMTVAISESERAWTLYGMKIGFAELGAGE